MRYTVAIFLFLFLIGFKHKRTLPYKIKVIVLGKMKERNVQAAMKHFGEYMPGKRIILDIVKIDMPEEAYYKPRNRYRAEAILKYLRTALSNDQDLLIAITDLPISTTIHGHKDYGICGYSFTGMDIAVASSYHLDKEMFLQTIRHEWGHAALNIYHCKHKNCIMNAANGRAENLRGHSHFKDKCTERYSEFCANLL